MPGLLACFKNVGSTTTKSPDPSNPLPSNIGPNFNALGVAVKKFAAHPTSPHSGKHDQRRGVGSIGKGSISRRWSGRVWVSRHGRSSMLSIGRPSSIR